MTRWNAAPRKLGLMTDPLTRKQRQIVDYMRGNGCVLTLEGREALKRRGVWTDRGISRVVASLWSRGLLIHRAASVMELTEEGRLV